ncbi:MAG: hypothetical protein N3G21_09890 [Candidatus Hydrogenedentes bacterium]|nr:hypothetical protein [Candidatus Hydrogenedentota bacterium]
MPRTILHRYVFITLLMLLWGIHQNTFSEGKKEGTLIKTSGFASAPTYVVRQLALENAIRNGVEKYLLSIAPEKYLKHLNVIINKSSKYIISLRVTNETLSRDSCSVEIEIEIDDESINRDVATFLMPYLEGLPSMLVLKAGEPKYDTILSVNECINLLTDRLRRLKFSVDTEIRLPEKLKEYYSNTPLVTIEDKKAFSIASDFDIVVMITPEVEIEKTHPHGDFVSCKGIVRIEVFRGSDGKLLDAYTNASKVDSYSPQDGVKQSLEDAFLKSVPRMISSSILGFINVIEDKALIIKLEGFSEQSFVDVIVTCLEKICYGCKLETLCVLPSFSKIKLYYDGPTVYIVDSLMDFPDLRNKISIKKVVNRNIEIISIKN